MMHPKESSGETNNPLTGAEIMKIKQEIGDDMKKEKNRKMKESIAERVSKRSKKEDGSSGSASFGPHPPSSLREKEVTNLMAAAYCSKGTARACLPDETPEKVPEGWFCVHEKYISKSLLRFPLPDLLLDLLDHYHLALPQLCPSVIRIVNGFITRAREEGVDLKLNDMMSLYMLKESTSSKGGSGTYYLPSRPGLGIFKFSSSDDDWRKKYFFVKIDESTVPIGRTLKNSWSDASGIEDPSKLSDKLTEVLHRRLKQSPCNWGSYTTLQIGSARFPF